MNVSTVLKYDGLGRIGYVAIAARDYLAWWRTEESGVLFVRDYTSKRRDWVEWELGCRLQIAEESGNGCLSFSPEQILNEESGCALRNEREISEFCLRMSAEDCSEGQASFKITFHEDRIEYSAELELIEPVNLAEFQCGTSANGKRGSLFDSDLIFDSTPQTHGRFYHPLHRPLAPEHPWFSPAPYCYPLHLRSTGRWMSVSLEPTLDQLDFSAFRTVPDGHGGLGFGIDYKSRPEIKQWTNPPLVMRFGAGDEFEALRNYAQGLVAAGKIDPIERVIPDWHRGVMVCGWHEQVQRAYDKAEMLKQQNSDPGKQCTQAVYEEHVAAFERAEIPFDILVIDLGWHRLQGEWIVDTEQWPDLRGFIDRQHDKGRKILMWICHGRGNLPDETSGWLAGDHGERQHLIDPNNERWLAYLRSSFERMLGTGPEDYGADGIKLDYTGWMPGPGKQEMVKPLHGVMYLYEQFKAVHDAAKQVKPDCLLDFQVANPHFAHLYDMSRLNDYFLPDCLSFDVMQVRARIADAVGFGALVDTDGPQAPDYLRRSWTFGNPSFYLSNKQLSNPEIVQAARDGALSFKNAACRPSGW